MQLSEAAEESELQTEVITVQNQQRYLWHFNKALSKVQLLNSHIL